MKISTAKSIFVAMVFISAILTMWIGLSYGAEYATYMRVIDMEHDLNYVKVMDEDGQIWEVVCEDFKTRKGEDIRKHDVVMVIMDLQYDSDIGVFLIGNSYIETKL